LGTSLASEFYIPTFRNTVSSIFIGVVSRKYFLITPLMKMELTESSETSVYYIMTPGKNPKVRIRHSEHGGSLKSRMKDTSFFLLFLYYIFFIWFFCVVYCVFTASILLTDCSGFCVFVRKHSRTLIYAVDGTSSQYWHKNSCGRKGS